MTRTWTDRLKQQALKAAVEMHRKDCWISCLEQCCCICNHAIQVCWTFNSVISTAAVSKSVYSTFLFMHVNSGVANLTI